MKRTGLILLLGVVASACAQSRPLPGDSVATDGAVSLATPALRTNVTEHTTAEPLSPIERQLYPVELVMENKARLGLSAAQQDAITKELDKSQSDLVKLQWELQTKKDELVAVLAEPKIDEARASKAAEALMQRENAIKGKHLALLVRIKNVLSPSQQEQLVAVRAAARCGEPTDAGHD